jgi:hypothetical protein
MFDKPHIQELMEEIVEIDKNKLPNKLFAWIWKKLGYLESTDKVFKVLSWRSCKYDTIMGNRVTNTFVMPWERIG